MSYSDANNNGSIAQSEIIEESNYYPFGLKHKGYNTAYTGGNATAQKFKYNGIELEEVTGLYEMDLRAYDPTIARWTGIDPVTHWSMSTYTAFDNNPVYWADPSGANSIYNSKTGQYVINGQEVTFDEALAYANNGGNADGNNNNTPNEDCPKCDNEDILLDFVKDTGYEAGVDRANAAINKINKKVMTDNFDSTEADDNNLKKFGTIVQIKGVKYILQRLSMNKGDYTYPFGQSFTIKFKKGNKKEFTAYAVMRISKDVNENNITAISLPISESGYFNGRSFVIKFYNNKGKAIVNLKFKNEKELMFFYREYFEKNEKKGYNTTAKNYMESVKIKQ